MYLTISRPNISYTVNKLSQYMTHPRFTHTDAVHHLLRYIKTTPGKRIVCSLPGPHSSSLHMFMQIGEVVSPQKIHQQFLHFLRLFLNQLDIKNTFICRGIIYDHCNTDIQLLWLKQHLLSFEIIRGSSKKFVTASLLYNQLLFKSSYSRQVQAH